MELMLLAFTILLFCAIMASLIAMRKGRSGLWWLFLGFVLGPFALAVALLPSSSVKKCPKCARNVSIEAQTCRYCGFGFQTLLKESTDSFRKVEDTKTVIRRIDDSDADKTIVKRIDDFDADKTIIKRTDDSATKKSD